MSSDKLLRQQCEAELSSIDFQIDDLVSRVISAAKSLEEVGLEASSHELFEVERSLIAASRRLRRASSELKL
ncbi:MAG: hypothetical protein CL453_06170 [Acidimicrobiaceae bacterium]|nr:hypothetical protein [Acidimicrobiaceae bacterium]|tara:strand:- start:636 stop:851 length:216 start_codon:yes stop_codon:yes gene_type:complete